MLINNPYFYSTDSIDYLLYVNIIILEKAIRISFSIVRVANKWTYEQTMYNPIRAYRPMNNDMEMKTPTEFNDQLELIPQKCDFCAPLNYTAIGMWENFHLLYDIKYSKMYF